MDELQLCPFCSGTPKLHKRKRKFYYECNGDCWTVSDLCGSKEEAAKSWNKLKYVPVDAPFRYLDLEV